MMQKTVIISVVALCITAIVCVHIYARGHRYVVANGGMGNLYRVDRVTGRTVLFDASGNEQVIYAGDR